MGGVFSDNRVELADLGSYFAPVLYFNTDLGTHNGDRRWDIVPGPVALSFDINVQDLGQLLVIAPRMLGGTLAFNGPTCPWP
jgi:hypothetical protein